MMKKWILILAAVMLLTVIAVPAFAADTKIVMTAASSTVYVGEEVAITVSVSSDTAYTSASVNVSYDSNMLEFVRAEAAGEAGGAVVVPYDGGTTGLAFMNGATNFSGAFQKIIFKVKAGVTPGTKITIGGTPSGAATAVEPVQVTVGCRHSFSDWTDKGDGNHIRGCTVEGCTETQTAAHEWQNAGAATPAGCETPGSQPIECKVCHAQSSTPIGPIGHAWDNDCDTTCNNGCGTTRAANHKYEAGWSYDAQNHWHKCGVCGETKDTAAHIPGPAATETAGQLCTVCPYVIKEALGHIHKFEDRWQQDATYHWRACLTPGCYVQDSHSKHIYDNDCDVTCNTCGHVRVAPHAFGTELKSSVKGHWSVCTLCGEASEITAHTPGEEATMDTPQVCTACQFWVKHPLSHVHTFGEIWEADDVNHWKACVECFEPDEPEMHSWDDGKVTENPTEYSEGSMEFTCEICKTKRTATLPKLEPQETEPTETKPVVTPNQGGGFPWIILIIIAGVLMLTGVGLFVFEFVRSRKYNMHGKFSNK